MPKESTKSQEPQDSTITIVLSNYPKLLARLKEIEAESLLPLDHKIINILAAGLDH